MIDWINILFQVGLNGLIWYFVWQMRKQAEGHKKNMIVHKLNIAEMKGKL